MDSTRFNYPTGANREFGTTRTMTIHRDPLYLFARHLEWCNRGSITAYQELVAALDDPNRDIRAVAETLVRRSSPHP